MKDRLKFREQVLIKPPPRTTSLTRARAARSCAAGILSIVSARTPNACSNRTAISADNAARPLSNPLIA